MSCSSKLRFQRQGSVKLGLTRLGTFSCVGKKKKIIMMMRCGTKVGWSRNPAAEHAVSYHCRREPPPLRLRLTEVLLFLFIYFTFMRQAAFENIKKKGSHRFLEGRESAAAAEPTSSLTSSRAVLFAIKILKMSLETDSLTFVHLVQHLSGVGTRTCAPFALRVRTRGH